MEYEGEFKILIDSKIYFEDEYFLIKEFLRDAISWARNCDKEKNMNYICIETEDNPLISFENQQTNWKINSPWQKFQCDSCFARQELEKAIYELETDVECQVECYKS